MDILAGGTGHKINSGRSNFSSRKSSCQDIPLETPVKMEIGTKI